ncbi:MAG: tRNA (adenosine(37)-N6)-threonylcarbamoyltransferase complex dimerization subunit type 1 TsaB [Mycoplasma sp.]
MYKLLIDCTSNYLIIALIKDSNLLFSLKKDNAKNHTENALEEIIKMIKRNNLNKEDIGQLLVVSGPGSFTGIRVALTIAKTWKIWNPSIQLFSTNSFLLNSFGRNEVKIRANRYEVYFANVDNLKLSNVQTKRDQESISDYESFNLEKIDLSYLLNCFLEVKKLEDFQPFYFKGVI